MSNLSSILDWQSVLLVRVTREPFTGTHCGLQVSRAHLALYPDGVVMSAWDVPEADRSYPRIRLVGWKPMRDVPFTFPVRFKRNGDLRVSAIIPNGTWVLPYDHNRFMVLQQVQMAQQQLLAMLEENPVNPHNWNGDFCTGRPCPLIRNSSRKKLTQYWRNNYANR